MTDVSSELAVDQSPHPTSSPDLLTAREHHRYCARSQPTPLESPSSSFGFLHRRASPHSGDLILKRSRYTIGIYHPRNDKTDNQSRRSEHRKPLSPESKPAVEAGKASHPGVKHKTESISTPRSRKASRPP
ncbi:Uncharacterized protein Rs2_44545 [Raphanus sativus]|nr:Uncharacterized protein Rs2_44545 [Raphanus sativus]